MLTFVNYLGGTDNLVLCTAPANWARNPGFTAEFPFVDIERAILGNETRRCFGMTKKHGFEYAPIMLNEFDATAFRQGLNRLKDELVAVPLWQDICITTATLGTTATTLLIDQAPTRYGAHWILLAPDNYTYEIVGVTLLSGTTLTLSARTGSSWPAGSRVFPLLFGRFDPRPTLESITPSMDTGSLKFIEDSAITEKLIPVPVNLHTVGSHIADFSTYKLWELQPVSEPRWLDTSEADILYAQLGFGRQEQSYPQQSWNRRGMELEFHCRTRDQIRYVETFFSDRLGPVRPFFIPTFRNDLRLAANITAGDASFQIAPSRYQLAAYDEPPGNAFLALIDPNGAIYPQRVNTVFGTTVTTESAAGENHTAALTRISFLMLCRFATTQLEWTYLSGGRANVKLKFLELPDEYVDPQPDEPVNAFLFEFIELQPGDGGTPFWYFTNYESPIVFGGNTYITAPFSLGERDCGLALDDTCELHSWGRFVGNPLNKFLPYGFNGRLIVVITRVTATAPDDGNARNMFVGRVVELDTSGREWTAKVEDDRKALMDRMYPRAVFQTQDNSDVYSGPTALDPDDWKDTGTIATLDVGGDTFQITVSGVGARATDWFSNGYLVAGTGTDQETRAILKSSLSGGIQTLTISTPLITTLVGETIALFAGYDGSREQRDSKFGDLAGFEGMPFMPDTNPSIVAADIKTPTGGKK